MVGTLDYKLKLHTTVNVDVIQAELNEMAADGWYLQQLIYPPGDNLPVSCWRKGVPPPPVELPDLTITALDPPNGALDVPETADLCVCTFDRAPEWGIAGGVYLRDHLGAVVETLWNPAQKVEGVPAPGTIAIVGNELQINWVTALAPLTGYWIGIDTNTLKDFAGIYPSNVWAFATPGGALPAADLRHERSTLRKDGPR